MWCTLKWVQIRIEEAVKVIEQPGKSALWAFDERGMCGSAQRLFMSKVTLKVGLANRFLARN